MRVAGGKERRKKEAQMRLSAILDKETRILQILSLSPAQQNPRQSYPVDIFSYFMSCEKVSTVGVNLGFVCVRVLFLCGRKKVWRT